MKKRQFFVIWIFFSNLNLSTIFLYAFYATDFQSHRHLRSSSMCSGLPLVEGYHTVQLTVEQGETLHDSSQDFPLSIKGKLANTRLSPNVSSMLGQCRRWCANNKPTLCECLVFLAGWLNHCLPGCLPRLLTLRALHSNINYIYTFWIKTYQT